MRTKTAVFKKLIRMMCLYEVFNLVQKLGRKLETARGHGLKPFQNEQRKRFSFSLFSTFIKPI